MHTEPVAVAIEQPSGPAKKGQIMQQIHNPYTGRSSTAEPLA